MSTTPTPPPEDDLPTIAYMICGGRIYKDQPVSGLLTAEDRVATRKDGSRAEPLVSQSAHEARIARLLEHIAAQAVRLEAAENALSDFRARFGLTVGDGGAKS